MSVTGSFVNIPLLDIADFLKENVKAFCFPVGICLHFNLSLSFLVSSLFK